ncbi:MAG TPA: AraC family transcriptional regulator [Hanamia sp.]|nr:AraC family transcriptional regulator [Hanamia sp.]
MVIRNQIQDDANELFHEYNRVAIIKKYIHDNIKSNLHATIISRKFELSISSLQHLFKKYEGQSYRHYLEDTRMTKAFELITKEGKRINEAMYATGYHNRVTFNIAFKTKFTYPPSYFRK